MSNSVDILIKADDRATAKFQNVDQALDKTVGRWQSFGKKTKAATEAIGAFANISGSSALGGFASQIAGITEKMSQFGEAAKAGGASSLAFQAGLAGLVGTIAFGLGKALADVIWKTGEFEKSMELANNQAARLDKSVSDLQSRLMAQAREDIELIQDPAEKQAAYQALIADLDKNIAGVSSRVEKSRKEVLKWSEAWKITGEQKAQAAEADKQLEQDEARLDALKRERDEIARNTGERAKNLQAIREENAAKEKSRAYIADLQREVQYLKATAEERRALDAMKNATAQDQGEAQRLLAERDAIVARQQAEKEAEAERKKASEERQREVDRIVEEKKKEIQRVEDLKKSERERLDLQRIELEQGKEAARIKEMMNQGIDEQTAKKFAAEETMLEKMKEDQEKRKKGGPQAVKLQATETRLLTRGASEDQSMALQQRMYAALNSISLASKASADESKKQTDKLNDIKENTKNGVKVVVPA